MFHYLNISIISRIDKNIEYFKQNSQTDVEQTLKRLREKYIEIIELI